MENLNFCSNCGISEREVKLYYGIVDEGYEVFCEKCAFDEHIPLVKSKPILPRVVSENRKKIEEKINSVQTTKKISDELAKSRGKEYFEKKEEEEKKRKSIAQVDMTLKEIIDRNYENKILQSTGNPQIGLIDNFHWIIMRARRDRKMSQAQLALAIGESDIAIRMAEQGKMPEDNVQFVKKLENYLNILIRSEPLDKKYGYGERDHLLSRRKRTDSLKFKHLKDDMKDFKIADLKKMNDEVSFKKNLALLKEAEEEALKEEYDRMSGKKDGDIKEEKDESV